MLLIYSKSKITAKIVKEDYGAVDVLINNA
jgi:hypothetical protein